MADADGSPCPETDRHNAPVGDPSRNVDALVTAAMDRQDDLRNMSAAHLREMMAKDTAHALERIEHAKVLRAAQFAASDEKLKSVDMQLALIERQRVEQKADTQKAVDAALAAQKEAVREQTTASALAIGKSENAMTKQVDQQGVTFATAIAGVANSQSDLKTRVERIENLKQGGRDTLSGIYAFAGFLAVVVVLLSAFIALRG